MNDTGNSKYYFMCDLQTTNDQEKIALGYNRLGCRQMFTVNSKQTSMYLFTICSFLKKLFTVTGNNSIMYSKNRIGNRNVHSKLPIIVFQIRI